jgi:Na+/melibiose symporter-like transporter
LIKRLGIVKNQLLVFSFLGSLLIFFFSKDLVASSTPEIAQQGVRMHYLAISLIFAAGAFYCYAYFRLPSSEQEAAFEREGKETVRRHRRKLKAQEAKGNAG